MKESAIFKSIKSKKNFKKMKNEIKKNIKIEVENYRLPKWILEDYGIVNEVKDGIVVVKEGLNTVGMSEMVIFEKTGMKGIVNFLGKEKSITVLGNIRNIKVGDMVKRLRTLPFAKRSKKVTLKFKRNYTNFNKFYKKSIQVKDGFDKMQNALKKYERVSKLIYLDKISTIFLMAGFFSWSLSILGISIIFSSFILANIALVEFIISFCINIYVYFKRILFIYNYDLDCNPGFLAKLIAMQTATTRFGLKSVMVLGGSIVSSNYVISEVTEVSPFKEYGKDYIYGDKTFLETTENIYNKIKDGPKD